MSKHDQAPNRQPKRPRGRPAIHEGENCTERITERLTPDQLAKYTRLGRGEWLRAAIDAAPEPAPKG